MRVVGIRLDPLYMLLGTVVVAAVFFSIFSPFLPHPYPHQQQQQQQRQQQQQQQKKNKTQQREVQQQDPVPRPYQPP